jgi:hypothetical protein
MKPATFGHPSLPPGGEYTGPDRVRGEGGIPGVNGLAPLPVLSLRSAQGPSPLREDRYALPPGVLP